MKENEIYFFMMRHAREIVRPEIKRKYRRSIRPANDPLARSLRDHQWREFWNSDPWRRVCNKGEWEYWYEFVIMPDFPDEPDEEIQKSIDELEVEINSPYDCTGRPFSRYIHWKRTPAGIVIVRHMALDV